VGHPAYRVTTRLRSDCSTDLKASPLGTVLPRRLRFFPIPLIGLFSVSLSAACAVERRPTDRPETIRWSLNGHRLGAVSGTERRLLTCQDHEPNSMEPWVTECYGGPGVSLGFDGDGRLAYLTEDATWGRVLDARELWRLLLQRFVGMLGTPDTVTVAMETTFGNKVWVYWSRLDVGDCAKLEVMSAPSLGGLAPGTARTVLTIGPRSTVPWLCPPTSTMPS